MALIKSAIRGLCFVLGLLTRAVVSFGHPSRGDGMNSTDCT
jgi:hypothetical protein